jgi:hypothetical protein
LNALGCPDVREVAPDFAFGILDGEARADVLLHLDHCPTCQRFVSELSETADAVVLLAPEAEPPPGFERRALDRIVETSRRRRWRTTKLVAATAAAAVILSVVTVRIVDQNREPAANLAPSGTAETVAMVGADGQKVGKVDIVSDGTTMALDLDVAYALPEGDYNIVLTRSGVEERLGVLHVTGGAGSWSGPARVSPSATQLELVEITTGVTRCSATLPAV